MHTHSFLPEYSSAKVLEDIKRGRGGFHMESIMDVHQSLLRTHGLLHESATILLSSRMEVLYASPRARPILKELKGAILRADVTVPPAILAYIGQRVMKQIQIQRVQANFAPIFDQCSISTEQGSYQCSSLGIPSTTAIDHAQIIIALREDRWSRFPLQPVKPTPRSLWVRLSRLRAMNWTPAPGIEQQP